MEEQPLVSVVIPAYNCEKYIAETLDSVIMQTYTNWEIIVVNDCSTDRTADIINKYQRSDNRITCITNKANLGATQSRLKAIDLSKGEFIAFLDSDDLWDNSKIQKQIFDATQNHSILSYTGCSMIDASGKNLNNDFSVPINITYKELLKQNIIVCSSVLVKADVIKEFPMEHDELHEDYIAWLKILKRYGCAKGLNDMLVLYRVSNNSQSRNKLKMMKMTYGVYKFHKVNFFMRLYYLGIWIYRGIKKHQKLWRV